MPCAAMPENCLWNMFKKAAVENGLIGGTNSNGAVLVFELWVASGFAGDNFAVVDVGKVSSKVERRLAGGIPTEAGF